MEQTRRTTGGPKCDGKGWHRITHHQPTGTRWSEQYQPKYATKRAAVEAVLCLAAINEAVACALDWDGTADWGRS